jgi:hypothetical protein
MKYKATNKTLSEEIAYSLEHVKINDKHTNKLGLMVEDMVCKAMVMNGNDPAIYQDVKMEVIIDCFIAINRMKIEDGDYFVWNSKVEEWKPVKNVFNYLYTVCVFGVQNKRKKENEYNEFINELTQAALNFKEEDYVIEN